MWYLVVLIIAAAAATSPDKAEVDLRSYTELFERAYLKDSEAVRSKAQCSKDIEAAREEGRRELEQWRRRAAREQLTKMKSSTPRWLTADGDPTSVRDAPRTWAVLDTAADAKWEVSSSDESPFAECRFEVYVRVFENGWTAIPLLNAGGIVSNWSIGYAPDHDDDLAISLLDGEVFDLERKIAKSQGPEEELRALLREKLSEWKKLSAPPAQPLGDDKVYAEVRSAQYVTPSSTESMLVVAPHSPPSDSVLHDTHFYTTRRAGLHRISFSLHSNVITLNKIKKDLRALGLQLHFPLTRFTLSIHPQHPSAALPAVYDVTTTPPGRHQLHSSNTSAKITVQVPTTTTLELKWKMGVHGETLLEKTPSGNASEPSRGAAKTATVRHEALQIIEEGNLVQSVHFIKYTFPQQGEGLSEAKVRICPRSTRVTTVSAPGLHTWKVTEGNGKCSLLAMSFHGGSADTLLVQVGAELDFSGAKHSNGHKHVVTLPYVICDDALRQSGVVAVAKAANIEVHEVAVPRGVHRIGVDDLSDALRYRAASGPPLVLTYKYLTVEALGGGQDLQLAVHTHEQLAVLDAIVEAGYYHALVMENGRTVHKLVLRVQNTKEQYLRLHHLPQGAQVWSLSVNSVGVKPVVVRKGQGECGESLLIPLLVGLPSTMATGTAIPKTSVEMVYASKNDFLTTQGKGECETTYAVGGEGVRVMDVTPPLVEGLPMEMLSVQVDFPENYHVFFSSSPRTAKALSALPSPLRAFVEGDAERPPAERMGSPSDITGPVPHFSSKLPTAISHRKGRKVVPKDYEFHDDGIQGDDEVRSAGLKIEVGSRGTPFKFERMLLEGERATLHAAYLPKEDEAVASWWSGWMP